MIKKIIKRIISKVRVEKLYPIKIPVMEGSFLKGKTAFISGGAGGIGFAIAERFIANGADIIISGRNKEKLKAACKKLGSNAHYVVLNLDNPENFDEVIFSIIPEFCSKIDILVNCSGIHGSSNFWDVTPLEWDEVMNVNLKGMYFLSQTFGKYFKKNQIAGHILNISSASALKHGKTPYEISKNGVRTITLGMAEEMIKFGIVVNCLAPGPTATSMLNMTNTSSLKWSGNPTGRVATPEEIANWAVLMVSDMGNYIVGDSFYVTGGSGTICIDR
ncbi:SDR family oxidoreductase [uncultured Dubosiella sp.]|uniref:SDR family NAD(P)-dependent oxidoreductase n=1 Tax=uncultured Dubosiella sp. TaxID=1937011 RepID=UPI0032B1CD95